MSHEPKQTPAILFVCLGNICRSPMAEGAMKAVAEKTGLECVVDSAGTADYHVGTAPDERAIAAARAVGVDISEQRARQITVQDFYDFTHIFALDTANLAGIKVKKPRDATARVALLLDALDDKKGRAISDPYHGDAADFQKAWEEILLGVNAIELKLRNRGLDARF